MVHMTLIVVVVAFFRLFGKRLCDIFECHCHQIHDLFIVVGLQNGCWLLSGRADDNNS